MLDYNGEQKDTAVDLEAHVLIGISKQSKAKSIYFELVERLHLDCFKASKNCIRSLRDNQCLIKYSRSSDK